MFSMAIPAGRLSFSACRANATRRRKPVCFTKKRRTASPPAKPRRRYASSPWNLPPRFTAGRPSGIGGGWNASAKSTVLPIHEAATSARCDLRRPLPSSPPYHFCILLPRIWWKICTGMVTIKTKEKSLAIYLHFPFNFTRVSCSQEVEISLQSLASIAPRTASRSPRTFANSLASIPSPCPYPYQKA